MNQPYTSTEIGYGGTPSRCPARQNLPLGQYLSCKEKLALVEIDKSFDLTDFKLETVPLTLLIFCGIYGFIADLARNPAEIIV